MGVLDDAIREHLELKRKHGAPEDVVQREEEEALGPPPSGLAPAPAATASPEVEERPLEEFEDEPAREMPLPEAEPDLPDEEPGLPDLPDEPLPEPPPAAATAPEPPLEPEVRREFDTDDFFIDEATAAEPEGDGDDEDEDVLEETPEFLQENPDQDRLWFEQRPPKDFDFND
jgi:hypothetical protein